MHKYVKIIGVTKTKINVSQWSDNCSVLVSHHALTIPQLPIPRIEKTMQKSIQIMILGLFTILRQGPAVPLETTSNQ